MAFHHEGTKDTKASAPGPTHAALEEIVAIGFLGWGAPQHLCYGAGFARNETNEHL
jgi:hypothetical protein